MSKFRLSRLIVSILLSVPLAYGQAEKFVVTSIAHAFVVGKTTLPPGTYRFTLKPGRNFLNITGDKKAVSVPILSRMQGPGTEFREGTIVFDTAGNDRVLSEVWMRDEGGLLVSAKSSQHKHEVVVAVVATPNPKLSGKAIYEQTCKKCHGTDGGGSQVADRFFGLAIPRLDSAYVQQKPNDEIRTVIVEGRRNMESVRMGQPTVRHLLPKESVDAVIAYVRSFKAR